MQFYWMLNKLSRRLGSLRSAVYLLLRMLAVDHWNPWNRSSEEFCREIDEAVGLVDWCSCPCREKPVDPAVVIVETRSKCFGG